MALSNGDAWNVRTVKKTAIIMALERTSSSTCYRHSTKFSPNGLVRYIFYRVFSEFFFVIIFWAWRQKMLFWKWKTFKGKIFWEGHNTLKKPFDITYVLGISSGDLLIWQNLEFWSTNICYCLLSAPQNQFEWSMFFLLDQ